MEINNDIKEKYDFLLDQYRVKSATEEVEKLATIIIDKQIESGNISEPAEVIEKLAEYRGQTVEELTVLDKAVDLGFSPKEEMEKEASTELGKIAEDSHDYSSGGNAEDRFVDFLITDD